MGHAADVRNNNKILIPLRIFHKRVVLESILEQEFISKNICRITGNRLFLERCEYRFFVYDFSTRGVDETGGFFHKPELACRKHILRVFPQMHVKRDAIACLKKHFKRKDVSFKEIADNSFQDIYLARNYRFPLLRVDTTDPEPDHYSGLQQIQDYISKYNNN